MYTTITTGKVFADYLSQNIINIDDKTYTKKLQFEHIYDDKSLDLSIDELMILACETQYYEESQYVISQLYKHNVFGWAFGYIRYYYYQMLWDHTMANITQIINQYNFYISMVYGREEFVSQSFYPSVTLLPMFKVASAYLPASTYPSYAIDHGFPDTLQEVYMDGMLGFGIYFKNKYQGVVSYVPIEKDGVKIVQLQTSKQCRLEYKLANKETSVRRYLIDFMKYFASDWGISIIVQSAGNNIYTSKTKNPSKKTVPMSKLLKDYDQVASHYSNKQTETGDYQLIS